MAKRSTRINENELTKMELRKLNALRKSIGDDLAEKAFSAWLKSRPTKVVSQPVDKTAEAIGGAIMRLVESGKIKSIPRGGYTVRRGRGRVVVEAAGG